MSEKTFYKMLLLSMAFHLVFLAAVGTSFKKTSRSINPLLNSYSVNLVDDVGGRSKDTGTRPLPNQRSSLPPRPQKQTPEMKKVKPVNQPKEAREPVHSLSPRKLPPKESTGTTKEELKRLEERIREIKRRTADSESPSEARRTAVMRGSEGSSGSGAGSGGQNPALIRYLIAMRDKIESSWHIPFMGSAKKNLEAKVIIKVRRDGRILDISIDKRSGNRAYDESVLRALRAIDPLPPIPSSIDEDPLEVEMTLRPEGVS